MAFEIDDNRKLEPIDDDAFDMKEEELDNHDDMIQSKSSRKRRDENNPV